MTPTKILIATPLYPPDIGGPALYSKSLASALNSLGVEARVCSYGFAKKMPSGIRHFLYFLKIIPKIISSDVVILLDTFSVGLPTVLATQVIKRPVLLRVGGDFLWESYVNRTNDKILLSDFYQDLNKLNFKEKIVLKLSKFVLKKSDVIIFNSLWLKELWSEVYSLRDKKVEIIENSLEKKEEMVLENKSKKIFFWAGRDNNLKSTELIKKIFAEIEKERGDVLLKIANNLSHEQIINEIKNSYATVDPAISDISPNFIFESVSLNKPFIMTKDTGLKDKFGNFGLFIDTRNEVEWEKAVVALLDSSEYNRLTEGLRAFKDAHSYSDIAREFIKIAEEEMGSK